MVRTRIVQISLMLGVLVACSQSSRLDGESQGSRSAERQVVSRSATDDAQLDSDALPIAFLLDTSGLPEHCQVQQTGYQICLKCSPRDLPITVCAESQLTEFAPAERCSHDRRQIVCDFDSDQYFNFDLERRSSLEDIYERVPLLVFGAKLVLAGQLNSFPREQKLVVDVLDTMQKYAKTFFTCGDLQPAVIEIGALIKTAMPEIPPAFLAMFQSQGSVAVSLFRRACQSALDDNIVVDWLAAMVKQVVSPAGLGSDLNLVAILSALNTQGHDAQINQILGNKDLNSVLNEIERSSVTSLNKAKTRQPSDSTAIPPAP